MDKSIILYKAGWEGEHYLRKITARATCISGLFTAEKKVPLEQLKTQKIHLILRVKESAYFAYQRG